ncbi:glycosyltransferase family 4 protein [Salinivibrio costicola]|uniref:Glycosyl transferase family 1 domain-containing protein n=1 Tax=Salinivibrio costicola subsp. alcaliphilus TaxID=272773 RepID=A0ABX3KML8_SALCS|nr:glycosyltransferase family 4 protein [Salinivibrio costicola]OOF32785.1 hypothetical protein BZJ21_14310 [Salinivibrio costicola subsp. alcaliphilus]
MNYHFVSVESYPNGGAAANRHLALLKGLNLLEKSVILYSCMHHTKFESSYFTLKSVNGSRRNKLARNIKALSFLIGLCVGGFRIQKGDVIVYLGTSSLFLLPLLFYAKLKRVRVYHERTELPSLMVGDNFFSKLDYFIYKKFLFRYFDGVFLINRNLRDAVAKFPKVKRDKLHLLNMVVDTSRFDLFLDAPSENSKTIVFCGDLSSPKDNVDILIRAFRMSLDKHPDLLLKLIGSNQNPYFCKYIFPLIDQLNLNENVSFTGFLTRNEVPSELVSASLLVLSRDNSTQAQFGFPTKLGEYLASSTPVVTTKTSDISFFLKDGESAFLAEPGSVESFAEKISLVFNDYGKAREVGRKGKIIAERTFSSLVVAQQMVAVIEGDSL